MRIFKYGLGLVVLSALWLAVSMFGALEGWWLSSSVAAKDTQGFVTHVESQITDKVKGNFALVIIEDQQPVFQYFSDSNEAVNGNTLFPLASMSKMFAAYGLLELLDAKNISVDAAIADYLTQWQLPDSEFANSAVTFRQLLAHTSGLTDQLGFGDYQPHETLPTLTESLNNPRASQGTTAIKLGAVPGEAWRYSGGGYLIIELLITEISGESFAQWMQKSVFTPLNMPRSSYAYLGNFANTSLSYDNQGKPATLFKYASSAATGLSSTTNDLTQFTLALLDAADSNTNATLQAPTGYKLGAAIWGAGTMLYAPNSYGEFVFGHDGANDPAINTTLRINPNSGDAIIALSTGNHNLASDIGYEWTLWQTGRPDFISFDKAIASAQTPAIVGILFILAILVVGFIKRK